MAISGRKTGSESGVIYDADSSFELRFVGGESKKARWKPSSFEIQMVEYTIQKQTTANVHNGISGIIFWLNNESASHLKNE